MKKIYILAALLLVAVSAWSQENNLNSQSNYIPCAHFGISQPVSQIFANFQPSELKFEKKESGDREHRKPHKFIFGPKDGPQYDNDPSIIQAAMGQVPAKAPIANFNGQTATGFRPMDPSGAAGPNHYVQMINSTTFRIYNKTGTVLVTGTLGNLWSPATGNNGDPIVLYDKGADRWFLAQFGNSTDKKIYIAVSTSPDPTGSYYTYTYVSPAFPDYLKFSVWHDGYYMTSNQAQKVFAFERSAMLVGNPTAKSLYVSFNPPQGSGFFCPMPGDASDGTLPTSGPCPIFSYSDNGWGASFTDAIHIYNMSVNWAPTTPTGTITSGAVVPTAAFNAQYNASWNDCIQPGTTQRLDGIGGILMYRAQWKPWSGYNTVVLNWGVYLSATRRSIMWCELRQDQTTNAWSVYQQGIYAPDTNTRWMGSIAMDNNGSIGMAYLKSNGTSIFPTLCYAGRRSCDPLGTLPITEEIAAVGNGYQTGTNRVGDYSHTSLDPDGITFWHTGEYFGGTSGGSVAQTKVFSFQLANCGNVANVSIAVSSGSNPSCSGSAVTFTATPFNGGTTPAYQWKVNGINVGTNSDTYTTSSLNNNDVVSCIMTSSIAGIGNNPATSNGITMSITAPTAPSVSIAASQTTICTGSTVTFTATPTNGGTTPAYQWKVNGTNVGTNSATYTTTTLTNGAIVTCVLTSNSTCATTTTATSNSITMTVNGSATPTISISASTNILCGTPSVTFTATATNAGPSPVYQWKVNGVNVGTNSTTYTSTTLVPNDIVTCVLSGSSTCPNTATLGTGTSYNTTTSDAGAFYPTYYGNGRQQYLIRATELTALGLGAGYIQSLGVTLNANVGNPATLNGYTIKMATTAATVLTTTMQSPTFTTVYGPTNYTPTVSTVNTMNLVTPFLWDGTSNVLIDICFSNQVTGTVAYGNLIHTATFNASTYYQADGAAGAGACTTATGVLTTSRPNFIIKLASATTATSNSITMLNGGNITPSVSITSTATSICSGTSVTFTATPVNGGTPTYQWKVNGTNAGTNSATFTTTTLTNGAVVTCDMTSSLACANPTTVTSNGITVAVNTTVTPSVSITASASTICAGTSVTFTANATNGGTSPSYQWKVNGSNVGTNSSTYTNASLVNANQVSCVLTSNATCATVATATSNTITMTVNPLVVPTISITASNTTICAGTTVTFNASVTNGGTPNYAWTVNGSSVGTNVATYSSNALQQGDVVQCTLTSGAACATPATVSSNSISMTVNSSAPATVAITASTNNICSGIPVTFTATTTNAGTNTNFQWKVNGVNVGTNANTYSSSSLSNNDVVTCTFSSTSVCPVTSTLGTGTTVNASTSNNGAFFPTAQGNGRQQYLIRATDLTALGMTAGNIQSIGVNVNSSTVGNPSTLNNYTVKMGHTTAIQTTSTFQTSALATVYGPVSYTPTVSSINTLNFTTPFAWNGTSNILVEICYSNQVTGTTAYRNAYSTISYNAATYAQQQGATTTICTTATGATTTRRPNFIFTNYPTSTPTSNAITMSITPSVTPTLTISSSTTTICAGSMATFLATPSNQGTSPVYAWKVNGNPVGGNSTTFSSNTLSNGDLVTCTLTSNAACASPLTVNSNVLTMTVNANPTVNAGTYSSLCAGGNPVALVGTPLGGTFTGTNVSANQFTPVSAGTYVVTYNYTDGNGCSNTALATILVNNCSSSLTVKAFLEGYYLGSGMMSNTLYNQGVDPNPVSGISDSLTVELHHAFSPFALAYSFKGNWQTNGNIATTFPGATIGTSYYIVLKGRNALETWSANPVMMTANVSYDFTLSAAQAFGNMQTPLSGGVFGLYSGDMTQDLTVDAFDYLQLDNDLLFGAFGYYDSDLNGDGTVDLFDYLILDPNLLAGLTALTP